MLNSKSEARKNEVVSTIAKYEKEMTQLLMELIRIPAISPDFGGEGEAKKAERLESFLSSMAFDEIIRVDAKDERAIDGIRPNIVALYKGKEKEKKLWILTHIDVVPPGDISKWTITSPFEPVLKDGKIYGRGSEDNGQSLVASIFAVKALMDNGILPERTVALAFVSDEESGSKYGAEYLVKTRKDLFSSEDWIVVPDAGSPDGTFIEIAEKSILWFKISVEGKQVHGSTPHLGLNAHRIGSELLLLIDGMLHSKYSDKDELFDPPVSTFEPTLAKNSSASPNIIPGVHEFVFDCRLLPLHKPDEVVSDIELIIEYAKRKYSKKIGNDVLPSIKLQILQRSESPPSTDKNSEIVLKLLNAIEILRHKKARVGGIGGGTVASVFRRLGIPSVVWSTIDETAHQPNEYAKVENMIEDSKVFSWLMLE